MKYFLKAITTNNRDLKSAVFLVFEERSYLFNCPDGFQRLALNQKLRFHKVRQIFLSSIHPDHYGGFPGFYLSAKESFGGDAAMGLKMGVFGPKGLQKLIKKGKMFYSGLASLEIYEYSKIQDGPYSEAFVGGKWIINDPSLKDKKMKDEEEKDEEKEEEKSIEKVGIEQFSDNLLSIFPVQVKSSDPKDQSCYSFICVPKQDRGKFLPKKAVELGCNPRVHFKLLSEGNPVTLEDGTMILPFQVMEQPQPAQAMILMFMPNDNYLDSLFDQENQDQFFSPYFPENIDSQKTQIHIIYHSIPLKVLLNDKYKQFMMKFGPNVKHIIDCHETNDETIARTKSWALSNRHKIVCPALIPLSEMAVKNYELENKELLKNWLNDIQYFNVKVGLIYNLYPLNSSGIDATQVLSNADFQNPNEDKINSQLESIVKQMLQVKQLENPQYKYFELANSSSDIDQTEPTIMFLGTVSMKPTMYRSASAIYMFVKGYGILMDCAEGSYGQIYDHFQTIDKINEAINKLRLVFLTHIHGDHQLGIIKIMFERDRLLPGFNKDNKLYIVTPTPMSKYLDQMRKKLKYPEMVVLVLSNDLNPEPVLYYGEQDEKYDECPKRTLEEVNQMIASHQPKNQNTKDLQIVLQQVFNIKHLMAIETDHCIESYGCLLDSPDFGRIFYSGDTRPCQNIINYCQKIKLLIHEATFEDSLSNDAHWKRHTTMGQAMDIAEKCEVWRTVLTHFSPRYQKIAEICDRNFTSKTMVAFDHMRIKLSYFEWAYTFLDVYKKLFTNDDVESQISISKEESKIGERKRNKQK